MEYGKLLAMKGQKRKFVEYLNDNISCFLSEPAHYGIKAVLNGDFSHLRENPTDEDWRMLALMINGYDLSIHLGLGKMDTFVRDCLRQYKERGLLPNNTIELWLCLYGFQREESLIGRYLEDDERQVVGKIYSKLRNKLSDTEEVNKMIKSLRVSDYGRYRNDLIHRYWRYQRNKFLPVEKYFDKPNYENKRPPVFLLSEANNNILTFPNTDSNANEELFKLIKQGEHHKWFRSMNSSQALTISVLGNLFVHGKLSILSQLNDDGLPLLGDRDIAFENFRMEHKINCLDEPRRTSVDAFISGDYQIAIECKFTEFEVGNCSRPRLTRKDSNYEQQYCNGSYIRQMGRKDRCALTEIGVKYWDYVPFLFHWNKDKDADKCPLRYNYQLVRNILAAGIKEDGSISPTNGQVVLIYDRRNPACQQGGKNFKSFNEVKEALIFPQMLRKITWQNIIFHMRKDNILPWLTEELKQKYGL